MNDADLTQAFLIEGRIYTRQPDGSLRPSAARTDWKKLDTKTEEEIEAAAISDPDALPMSDEEWTRAVETPDKKYIHVGVDEDAPGWFTAQGRFYQTRINAVLAPLCRGLPEGWVRRAARSRGPRVVPYWGACAPLTVVRGPARNWASVFCKFQDDVAPQTQ